MLALNYSISPADLWKLIGTAQAPQLIDARRVGKVRLVGRYVNQGAPEDSSPWVGQIIDPERIDGEWSMGRWDLRRKLADK